MSNVTVYTSQQCPNCVMVKNFLKKKNIPFSEVDVQNTGVRDMLTSQGFKALPVVVTKFENVGSFTGFSVDKLLEVSKTYHAATSN